MRDVLAQRPRFRKSSTLLPRILSAAILIPLSLYLIYLGPPYAFILIAMTIGGIFYEWTRLVLKCEFHPLFKIIYTLAGTTYLCVASLWTLKQIDLPDGWKLIYWLLFLVWSTDMSAFAGGKLLKGPKLSPSISPNKTWSGFLCGMIVGTGLSYALSFWLIPNLFSFWDIMGLVFIGQGGDLLESKAKRWSHVKDSGFLIPGHGGFLDRLDSLIAVIFTIALWQVFH